MIWGRVAILFLSAGLLPAQVTWESLGGKPSAPARPAPPGAPSVAGRTVVHMKRVVEPRETAFWVLVPEGWRTEGGILRINPLTTDGSANTVSAKVDFTVKRDAAGTVMIHWAPSMIYKDPRGLVVQRPIGSSYMGALVLPLMSPYNYLMQMVFRPLHPQAQGVQALEQRPAPEVVRSIQRQVGSLPANAGYRWDAGSLTLSYTENGVAFKEKLFTVMEDWGQQGLFTWCNKDTIRVRAPVAEFDRAVPLLDVIQGSVTPNPQWVAGERQGSAQRAAMALETQRYVSKVAQEIVENRRRMHAEIRHSMWLNMTNQEDYVNPYTGEVELGSNQWRHRWVNGNGDVIYTDDPNYDPNRDPALRRTDYRRSVVRPR